MAGGDLERSWIANADAWIAAVRGRTIESRRLATDHAIVEAVLRRNPGRVLDLGCGEGWLVRALARRGVESVGVDGSRPLVDAARAAGEGVFHACSYAEFAAVPGCFGRRFDVVTANFALLDAEPAALLRALRSALAPGGALVIQTVYPWAVGGEYRDGWRTEDFNGFGGGWQAMPWYFRTLESWFALLQDAGYAIVQLSEPRHPDTGAPLSLLFVAEPRVVEHSDVDTTSVLPGFDDSCPAT